MIGPLRLSRRGFSGFFLSVAFVSLSAAAANRVPEAKLDLNKAVSDYDKGDFGAAKTYLDLALEAEPNFAEAYVLKALLQNHDGDVEAAQASLKRALELNPRLPEAAHHHLQDEAHEIEAGLSQEDFSHFHIEFHGADQRNQAWDSVAVLDSAYNQLGSLFGSFPTKPVTVAIFTTAEFWEAWKAPLWLGGFFDKQDGKVRVRMDVPPGGNDEMQRRLRHEFTHAFIHQLYPNDLPMWFQEGIAQFYAYANPTDPQWKDTRLEELHKLTEGAPHLSMAQIQDIIFKKNASPAMMYLAYLESEGLVLSIAKDRGDSWIPSMITALQKGATFDAAFHDVVGITPGDAMDQLQKRWE